MRFFGVYLRKTEKSKRVIQNKIQQRKEIKRRNQLTYQSETFSKEK